MSHYSIHFTKCAEDDAVRLDTSIFERVSVAIETKLAADPFRFGKSLNYSLRHVRSLRVGDWRVLYQISDVTVIILTIRHRKKGYDDLG
jgi:mRNA-degrading endonuclease RelE of RelBE toxin-antitoxin system